MNELGKVTTPTTVSKLYEELATLYEHDQEPELRAIALEKAIEGRPNDTNLQFGAAYSYSMKKLEALALLYYKTLLHFQPDHATALNNIGVQYRNLEMPIRSVKHYKMSAQLNETLAMANLAYIFMGTGLGEEASDILRRAMQQEHMHQHIGSAVASLSEREEGESKTEERYLNSAREQQRFFLAFAEAYFIANPNGPNFNGSWQLPNGIEVMITQAEAQIEAHGARDGEEYKFTGRPSNRGARIKIERKTKRTSTLSSLFRPPTLLASFSPSDITFSSGAGYAYLSPDGQQLFIMSLESNVPSFETLTRIK